MKSALAKYSQACKHRLQYPQARVKLRSRKTSCKVFLIEIKLAMVIISKSRSRENFILTNPSSEMEKIPKAVILANKLKIIIR